MGASAKFGRYEIVRRLGGSMAEVYLALDAVVGRQAVLKLIRRSGDPASLMAIEAERRGAAIQVEMRALDPRVVEIYEFGEIDGYFFVAMEYVEGRSLARRCAREPPWIRCGRRLSRSRFASNWPSFIPGGRRWCNGDIKPRERSPWPQRYGAACSISESPRRCARGPTPPRTIFGSPGYCSPERLNPLAGESTIRPVGGGGDAL